MSREHRRRQTLLNAIDMLASTEHEYLRALIKRQTAGLKYPKPNGTGQGCHAEDCLEAPYGWPTGKKGSPCESFRGYRGVENPYYLRQYKVNRKGIVPYDRQGVRDLYLRMEAVTSAADFPTSDEFILDTDTWRHKKGVKNAIAQLKACYELQVRSAAACNLFLVILHESTAVFKLCVAACWPTVHYTSRGEGYRPTGCRSNSCLPGISCWHSSRRCPGEFDHRLQLECAAASCTNHPQIAPSIMQVHAPPADEIPGLASDMPVSAEDMTESKVFITLLFAFALQS